jgi:hypothetical protein
MSLDLIRQNSSSPFQLQRSMVSQGDGSGAYEQGGFNPDNIYNDGGAAAAITSFGNSITAGLNSITASDKNNMNEKKADRLEKRSTRIEDKQKSAIESGNTNKADRLIKRNTRVENRLSNTKKQIEDYKQSKNPTLKSEVKDNKKPKETTVKSDIQDITEFE